MIGHRHEAGDKLPSRQVGSPTDFLLLSSVSDPTSLMCEAGKKEEEVLSQTQPTLPEPFAGGSVGEYNRRSKR
jgi:hypothetical protein